MKNETKLKLALTGLIASFALATAWVEVELDKKRMQNIKSPVKQEAVLKR